MVLNIGDGDTGDDERGVSVALTRNYVSGSNLSDVLRFLDTRVSQISGCRDRDEAVQPEELGSEFRKALSTVKIRSASLEEEKKVDDEGEETGRWTELLKEAEVKAKEGWNCDAWVDLSSCHVDGTSGGDCEDARDQLKDSTSTKSSVLSRAKQSSSSGCDANTPASSGAFSFSFM
jgi:hypothetical protein